MVERPIIFSHAMVRALKNGKSQTRRVIKPQPLHIAWFEHQKEWCAKVSEGLHELRPCPYGKPGDRLWVKETWKPCPNHRPIIKPESAPAYWYEADNDCPLWADGRWKSPLFMPREASRLVREITDVRVQRIQGISDDDIANEGISNELLKACPDVFRGYWRVCPANLRFLFAALWDSLHAKPKAIRDPNTKKVLFYISYPWEDVKETRRHRGKPWYVNGNPWVWALDFKEVPNA